MSLHIVKQFSAEKTGPTGSQDQCPTVDCEALLVKLLGSCFFWMAGTDRPPSPREVVMSVKPCLGSEARSCPVLSRLRVREQHSAAQHLPCGHLSLCVLSQLYSSSVQMANIIPWPQPSLTPLRRALSACSMTHQVCAVSMAAACCRALPTCTEPSNTFVRTSGQALGSEVTALY